MDILADVPIYIDDASATNVLQMKAMARRLQAEKGLGLEIDDLKTAAPEVFYDQAFDGARRESTAVAI
jgi:replicative DNA helicase